MNNRGNLRGIGQSPRLGIQRGVGFGYIFGPYPFQPWSARLPRPMFRGQVYVKTSTAFNPGNGPGLRVTDGPQAAQYPNTTRQVFQVDDGAGVVIDGIGSTGGNVVYGDHNGAVANANAGTPGMYIDATTIPAALLAQQQNVRFIMGSGVPTGAGLNFFGNARVGDLYYDPLKAGSFTLYRCTTAGTTGSSGTAVWTGVV